MSPRWTLVVVLAIGCNGGGGGGGDDDDDDDDVPPLAGLCTADGWCWQNPLPQGDELRGLWADADRVIAVGAYGTILTFEDGAWRDEPSPTVEYLTSIGSDGAGTLIAVGAGGRIARGGAGGWTEEQVAANLLLDVWAAAPDAVWAVGQRAGSGSNLYRFDGTTWIPESAGTTDPIAAVSGTAADDVWAVSWTTVLHRDAAGWTATPLDLLSIGDELTDIHAIARDDVWATASGLVLHYDGLAWQLVDVGGEAPEHIFAVGGHIYLYGRDGALVHHDGVAWSWEQVGTNDDLLGLGGPSPSDLWVVGSNGLLRRFDGTAWTNWSAVPLGGKSAIVDVWGSGPTDVLATGNDRLLRFDGARWDSREADYLGADVQVLWGAAADDVYAVGNQDGTFHYDGATWRPVAGGPDGYAIWGAGANDVFIGGEGGAIWHGGAAGFTQQTSGTTVALLAVWGTGPSDVYAAGGAMEGPEEPTLLHYDGSAWTRVDVPGASSTFRGVWGAGGDLYVVESERVHHRSGGTWTVEPLATARPGWSASASRLWGSGPDDVWLAGTGTVYHREGGAWRMQAIGTGARIRALWGTAGHLWAVGDDDGTILHRAR